MFIGREKELAFLEKAYNAGDSQLIPIYGRRRVGKSELILKFIQEKHSLYFLGKTAPAGLQIKAFLQSAAQALAVPLLADLPPENWAYALAAVTERLPESGKYVMVLDEFQWMAEASPELPSLLQEYWDRHWRPAGNFMLILCGSFIGFMEREVLGRKSPLYGRRTAQILLNPFTHQEAAGFHPRWSLTNQALAYFICGGIPAYLLFFKASQSIEKNIETQLLDEFGSLFREPEFLLREELRDVTNYYAVLTAIATGAGTHRQMAQKTGIAERSLPYYLGQLTTLGYVQRRHPLTGKRPNPRNVRYAVSDPLLRFWFRFVFPNLSFLQQLGPRRVLRERIRPQLNAYWGGCFERLCRRALPGIYITEGVSAGFEVGEYWDPQVQIDVVGLRDDNWTDIGECKWGAVTSTPAIVRELAAKAGAYPNLRGATIGRRVFAKTKPGKQAQLPADITWHSLEDLYV